MKRSTITGAACLVLVAATLMALSPARGDAQAAGLGVTLHPAAATNDVGTSHTITANVHDFSAVLNPFGAGLDLTFTVTAGPNTGATGQGTTNADSQVAFTYTSNGTPGVDTIEACPTIPDPNVEFICGTAMKAWGVPLALPTPFPAGSGFLLTPLTATNPVGTSHTVTVTLPGAVGLGIFFVVTAGPNAGPAGFGRIDANGEVSMTYTSNGTPGTDTIAACVGSGCATVSKTWEQPPQQPSVQAPTPAPTMTVPPPIATATSAPTSNGGNPADGSSGFPWWALAIAAAVGVFGGLGLVLAYSRGRTRQT